MRSHKGQDPNLRYPSLDQVEKEQLDLQALCSDRELVTREIFRPNAFYGHDYVLKTYAGLPVGKRLKVVIPHAASFEPGYLWKEEVVAPLPAVHAYPDYMVPTYERASGRLSLPSASPYVYAVSLVENQGPPRRRGTIFFPSHSTHLLLDRSDTTHVARALTRLPAEFQPVSVCIYWKDLLLGRADPFREAGLPLVSAGHIFDRHFLFRFHHLVSRHRFAAGQAMGSHVFHSVYSGCRFFHIPEVGDVPRFGLEGVPYMDDVGMTVTPSEESRGAPDIRAIFLQRQPVDEVIQKDAAAFFLGAHHLLSPDELKGRLLAADRLDLWGSFPGGTGRSATPGLPFFWKRVLRAPSQHAGRMLRAVNRRISRLR